MELNQDSVKTVIAELPSKRRTNDAVTQFTLIVLIALDVCLRLADFISRR